MPDMHDIIVIGAGTAGLTAAIYARRASKSVLVLEAKAFGGQIINTPRIENFPSEPGISGFDYSMKLYSQTEALGAELAFEKALDIIDGGHIKTVVTSTGKHDAKAVIIATGSENRKLGLDGEDKLVGRGISYCATCDGALFKKKDVAVVGGGNTALEDAIYLSDLANTVYLIHRRDGFRGESANEVIVRSRNNIKLIMNSNVTGLVYDKKLSAVVVTDKQGVSSEIPVSGLFVAIGRIPENMNFSKLIALDESGYAIAGENCKTKTPGIFVAGDNRTKEVRQLVTAAADGAVASNEACKYINALEG